ncbi:MAG: hypothetical protein B6I20_13820 [Bacteroidetes bacterium 4572_117]|nr:MAG: hypothetical protein B6I20_13820 [Bacteroidetes bacterium 4572_117]
MLQLKLKSILLIISILLVVNIQGQTEKKSSIGRSNIIKAAKEIMKSAQYCTLISTDSMGEVHARMMETFPLGDNFAVWFGTNKKSRKVAEIRKNPKVAIYYAATDETGYLTIYGNAELVNEPKEKLRLWKKEWKNYFTDRKDFILIKVIPQKMEIISYKHGINGNKETWEAVNFEF